MCSHLTPKTTLSEVGKESVYRNCTTLFLVMQEWRYKLRKNLRMEVIQGRVQKMIDLREEYLKDIENVHIKIQKGNNKTGENCYTISLIPIADCVNCSGCSKTCYDICNVCYQPKVQNDRAKNSALHKADPERFWKEVDIQIKAHFVREFRINVGGDLTDEDFAKLKELYLED